MKRSGMKAKYSPTEKGQVAKVEFVVMPQQLLVYILHYIGKLVRSPSHLIKVVRRLKTLQRK